MVFARTASGLIATILASLFAIGAASAGSETPSVASADDPATLQPKILNYGAPPLAASREAFIEAAFWEPARGGCEVLSPDPGFVAEMLVRFGEGGAKSFERRVALVIGNEDYQSIGKLKNPANDATSMARMFRALGFTVYRGIDATNAGLNDCFNRFKADLEGDAADIALFYYAGHGVQLTSQADNEKRNYMLSVDAKVDAAGKASGFKQIDAVLNEMRAHSKQAVFLYDACRNAPFGEGTVKEADGQGVRQFSFSGAAAINADQSAAASQAGLFIAYATSPGKTADDAWGKAESNHSPFTEALLSNLPTPGESLSDAVTAAQDSVKMLTGGRQVPWISSSQTEPFRLNGGIRKLDVEIKATERAALSAALRGQGLRGAAIAAALKGLPAAWPTGDAAMIFRTPMAELWRAYNADVVLTGHIVYVEDAQFSPDGKQVVTAAADGTARVWDARTGATLNTLRGHALGYVTSAAFSPDGGRIVTGSYDKTAKIWDARTGAVLMTLEGHTGSVQSVAFSPDGGLVATASNDYTVRIWDARSGAALRSLNGHSGYLNSVSFSSDGARIVTASIDGSARIWDTATGAQLARFGEMRDRASAVPQGGVTLAQAAPPAATGDAVQEAGIAEEVGPEGELGFLIDARFSPDGRTLATANSRVIRVWDIETRAELSRYSNNAGSINAIAFSSDGGHIAAGLQALQDGNAIIWDVKTGKVRQLLKHGGWVNSVEFDADNRHLLTASRDGTARLWTLDKIKSLTPQSANFGVAFSPNGVSVLTTSRDPFALLWDAVADVEPRRIAVQSGFVIDAGFSPDGRRIATASSDGAAAVWDLETNTRIQGLQVPGVWAISSEFSPDGRRVATAFRDHKIRVWDSATGAVLATLEGHCVNTHPDCLIYSARFSPDGKRLVTASIEGRVRLWNAQTGSELRSFEFPQMGVTSAQFAPDGKRLLVTLAIDRTARILDPATGEFLAEYAGHEGPSPGDAFGSAAFSPDGLRLVVLSGGPEARLWDFTTRADLGRIEGRPISAAFDPAGRRLTTASEDGARILDLGPYGPKLLGAAHDLLTDDLREEVERERIRYWEVDPSVSR